jgi:hypothetical protein
MGVPISNVTRRVVFAPSGTGPYAFTFEILAVTDIEVYKGDTLLTLTTDYTVTINTNGTGEVNLVATAGTDNITIIGARAIERSTDFVTGGDFFANTVNTEFDSLTIFAQQNAEGIERALRAPETDPTTINMTLPRAADRADKFLAFDASGNPVPGAVPQEITDVLALEPTLKIIVAIEDEIVAVAGVTAGVVSVAAISTEVSTIAGISTEIVAVEANETNINTVATDLAGVDNIGTVAGSIADVNAVGQDIADVIAVAAELGAGNDITVVAADLTGSNTIGAVATIATDVSTVASISTEIVAVEANETNINTVAADLSGTNTIGTVSINITNVNKVAAIDTDITVVAAIDTDITTVATNVTDITNFSDVYLGPKTSDPSTRNDSSALQEGDLYFNTSDDIMKVYTGSAWTAAYVPSNGFLAATNNLSDLTDAEAARDNLGIEVDGSTGAYQLSTGDETERPGSPTAGLIRFNTDASSFEGYDGAAWGAIGGGVDYERKTANYTIAAGEGVIADTSSGDWTLTLPTTPAEGDYVVIADGAAWGTNNLTVARNGSTIEGVAQDLVLDISGVQVTLIFDGTTWQVYSQVGGAGGNAVTLDGTQTLTNKTINLTSNTLVATSAQMAAAVTDETGSGALVFANSPTLVTPALGTPASGNLGSCTADGTDAVGFRNIPQNSQSAAYTLVLADAGKHILHPSADTTARTFTIPANGDVAFPIGTAITFINQNGAGVVTIAITTDTMRLSPAGTTGSRTLAANGSATAIKITSTEWLISGSGLT